MPTDPPARDPLEERVVGSRVVHKGHYLSVRVDTIERIDGTRAERDVVGHPGAVAILALDEADRVLFVRQWRSPAGRAMLEIPAGTLDIVDAVAGTIEDHALAAPRELEEETGYRAGTWRLLTQFWTAPGFAGYVDTLGALADAAGAPADAVPEVLALERAFWDAALG